MSTTNLDPTEVSTADLARIVAEQQERLDELEAENDRLRDRVDELESEATVEWDGPNPADLSIEPTEDGAAVYPYRAISQTPNAEHVADLEDRVADLETSDGDDVPTESAPEAQTPLEQVVGLPEHLADEQLSANQDRARFVASDVKDYAQSVPKGWSIDSAELRRILQAYDSSGHTETVTRVQDILADLGGDDVELTKRRGTKRVVFSDELVGRLVNQADGHDVVMEATG